MKTFNQTISIEVSVDNIAQQLLSTISPDFKHREMLVESIIGPAVDKGLLSYVYNSLNGYTADIDFKEGDQIICTETTYQYGQRKDNTDFISGHFEIGSATVIEVNPYSSDKLRISFFTVGSDGTRRSDIQYKWVSHHNCSKVVIEPAAELPTA